MDLAGAQVDAARRRARPRVAVGAAQPRRTGHHRTSPPALLRVEEAATLLCTRRSTAYELIRTHQLRSVKIGGSRRVPRAAIETYIADLEAQQARDR